MRDVHYAPGEVIFAEGDASESVGWIRSGRVEVLKRTSTDDIVLGDVGAGEFVGEMGVIAGRPRVATVRAKTEAELQLLDPSEFTARLGRDPEMALQILLRLGERLRAANQRLAELQGQEDGAATGETPPPAAPPARSVRILPGSARVTGTLPSEGLEIEAFPFHVGRPAHRRERPAPVRMGLLVPDAQPFRLSRAHFAVVAEPDGGFAVHDVGSHLGTIVNGDLIGQHAPRAVAPLRQGENVVVAGGRDSPYVFRIVLP